MTKKKKNCHSHRGTNPDLVVRNAWLWKPVSDLVMTMSSSHNTGGCDVNLSGVLTFIKLEVFNATSLNEVDLNTFRFGMYLKNWMLFQLIASFEADINIPRMSKLG